MEFFDPKQEWSQSNPYWIYPLEVLEIKCEVSKYSETDPLRGIQTNFMNLEIKVSEDNPANFSTCKFDKHRALPFVYTQHIKFHSNRSIRQSYSIAISQSVPILYLSNLVKVAIVEIKTLIDILTKNGFYEPRLRKTILNFLNKDQFPGLKFDI